MFYHKCAKLEGKSGKCRIIIMVIIRPTIFINPRNNNLMEALRSKIPDIQVACHVFRS